MEYSNTKTYARGGYSVHVSQDTAWDMMQHMRGYWIIDVRAPEEYKAGHIPGAVNIPADVIQKQPLPAGINRRQTIFMYCQGGGRSRESAEILIKRGYTRVYDFGGLNEWTGEIVKE